MRSIRAVATGAVILSLAPAASARGGGSGTGGGSDDSPEELTCWAFGQGASIEVDKKVIQPELDKFEWAYGYGKRFGLVHVDHAAQVRTVKGSGHRYADTIRGHANRTRQAARRHR
ncbi:family 1 glycosylhydrolase [Streptomyces sp. NPDC020731]|uniref:family 1 glycosylhydrolase n=1 Tax=Streptomyces sp. NPDC020731 TaxID=3365085 RepID=UPI0037A51205